MIVSLIAAMDRNRLIGNNNALPWHLPADFAWFKARTMNKPVIMGRKTWESIGKPLPGRTNIVISRQPGQVPEGVVWVSSLEQALAVDAEAEEVMIIGGSTIYELAMPRVSRMYLTYVDAEFEGDAWFPQTGDDWQQVSVEHREADEKNAYACEFVVYERERV